MSKSLNTVSFIPQKLVLRQKKYRINILGGKDTVTVRSQFHSSMVGQPARLIITAIENSGVKYEHYSV
jgi:hypothetical protein